MKEKYNIEVVCLFCGLQLTKESEKTYKSGELIKCSNCGEMNDYESVIEVARENGIAHVKKEVTKDLEKMFKDLFQ